MLDSPQLRRIVVSTINGVQYDQSRYLTYWWNLDPQNHVVFFQFYLAKGLIYRHFVSIESEALFWLLQNVLYDFTGDYHLTDKVHGGVISTWLMSIVPSKDHIHFMFDSIKVEHREILKKYDNVKRVGFSSRISREMGWIRDSEFI
jgi:hypothetical protein